MYNFNADKLLLVINDVRIKLSLLYILLESCYQSVSFIHTSDTYDSELKRMAEKKIKS